MAINFPSTAGQPTDGTFTYQVAGLTYSWNGESWSAAGGGATATDLTVFGVVTATASGGGALSYNNSTGDFTFTPPDLSGYLTSYSPTPPAGSNSQIQFNSSGSFGASSNLTWNNVGSVLNVTGDINSTNIGATGNVSGSYLYGYGIVLDTDLFSNPPTIRFNRAGDSYYVDVKLSSTNGTSYALTLPVNQGAAGTFLQNNGSGTLSWASAATTGLQSRSTVSVTQSIPNGSAANISFTTPKTYVLYSIQTSHAAWVTLYMDTTSRTADVARSETTDPTPGSGVLAEVITTGSVTQWITPGAICFNSASGTTTYAKVVNKSGATANVQVTLQYLQIEG